MKNKWKLLVKLFRIKIKEKIKKILKYNKSIENTISYQK